MISPNLKLVFFCFLASQCASKTPVQRGFGTSNLEKRAFSHSDHDQCDHHGKPETFRGQESRFEPSRQYLPAQESKVEPSRQYLPQPGPVPPSSPPNDIEAPAASFDQPNFVSIQNTFVSPTLQNNYKSLFGQDKKDLIAPAAAQSPPDVVPPPAPRVTSDKKHSHDDEDNLERLCNDAFHSFLCKPIKGPRKTPNGRLRPNAVIPPDVLSGLASFQNEAKVKPDPPKYTAPTQRPYSPTTPYVPPTTTKKYESFIPEVPSPSNNNIQVIKPAAQTPGYFYEKPSIPFPTNQNQQFATQRPTFQTPRPTTPRPVPTQGYSYDKPNIPFPSNTVQKYAQPPKHDCDKEKSPSPFLIPNPSNENPSFLRPLTPSTPKPTPKTYFTKPTYSPPPKHDCDNHKPHFLIPNPSNENPAFLKPITYTTSKPVTKPFYTKPTYTFPPKHDCDKEKPPSPFLIPNPSNQNPAFLKPLTPSTPKPVTNTFYSKQTYQSTNSYAPFRTATQPSTTLQQHDCQKHAFYHVPSSTESPKLPLPSNNIAQISPYTPKPHAYNYYQNPISPSSSNAFLQTSPPKPTHDCKQHSTFAPVTTERAKLPSASNNIAQIIAQPQQVNTIRISPQKSGYFYEKPAVPFPPPSPTTQRPPPPFSYQTTSKPGGYNYDQPRIPFPSNNIAQIISQPSTTTQKPCEHKPSFPVVSSPTNQNTALKPAAASEAYVYDKPNQPFNGYNYDKPANPFLLPSAANNAPQVISSPTSGYTYDKPNKPFPPQTNLPSNNNQITISPPKSTFKPSGYSYEAPKIPFPTNINSKIVAPDKPSYVAKPQTRVEVTVRPGYSYDRPSNPFTGDQGYTYPEPAAPFIS